MTVLAVLSVLVAAAAVGGLVVVLRRRAGERRAIEEAVGTLAGAAGAPLPSDRSPGDLPAAIVRASQELLTRAEADRDLAARSRSALAALPDPILLMDPAGRAVLANPALEALAGVRPLGRSLEELFPASDLRPLQTAAGAGEPATGQLVVRRTGGTSTWEVTANPIQDGRTGGPGPILMTFRDITEASRGLQIRADFVANASHELRTPIAAIRMAMETLDSSEESDAPLRARLLSMIAGQVERLEELARDLLDLSRLESEAEVRHEPVPASALAESLRSRFAPACVPRRLTLQFETAPELERMSSDRRLLELILGNLIDNAAKFAFEGTAVRVVGRTLPGGGVRLEVIDRGIGIPLDQQQRIFERFYQVDPSRSGTRRGSGLGLAIVKHAVRRLGGAVRVSSIWQQGTTVTVELPGVLSPG